MRDDFFDVLELSGGEELKRRRVCVCIPEGSLNIDFPQCGGREGEHDVARAHSNEHDLAAGDCGLREARNSQ